MTRTPRRLINRGEVHLRLGNIMDAVHDFARVVELDAGERGSPH